MKMYTRTVLLVSAMVGILLKRVHCGPSAYNVYMEDAVSSPELFWEAVFPGTKWCGNGNIAESDDDLGTFEGADRCCRTHDNCFDYIISGEKRHGLANNGIYSKFHCKCDMEFYQCLKASESSVSDIVGAVYFDGLGFQCFDNMYPARCAHNTENLRFLGKSRCADYEYDSTRPEVWQWFDVPNYKGVEIY